MRNIILAIIPLVLGHGRLMDPPGRGTAWRFAESNEVIKPYSKILIPNYTDNGSNCGGLSTQVSQGTDGVLNNPESGGLCGVCGDNYSDSEPRKHEEGGVYGKGVIVKQYVKNSIIKTQVQITAHHKGWMEYRLCPNAENMNSEQLQQCFNSNILKLATGGARFELPAPGDSNGAEFEGGGYWYNVDIVLPDGVTCDRCVMQWIYHGGNNWGCDTPDNCGMAKGPQEEFLNCADIQIVDSDTGTTPTAPPPPTTTTTTPISTTTTTMKKGYTCEPWQNQYPFPYVLDTSDKTISKNPSSCTKGGHEGKRNSICYITCPDEYDVIWKNTKTPRWRRRTSIKCNDNGSWEIAKGFRCGNPCPKVTKLKRRFVLRVKQTWPTGMQLLLRFIPEKDINGHWTFVIWFNEKLQFNLNYDVWQARMTVSAHGQVISLVSMSYNMNLKAGEVYNIVFVVSGADKKSLPVMNFGYVEGEHFDMSCLVENNYDTTTTTLAPATTTTTKATTTAKENG